MKKESPFSENSRKRQLDSPDHIQEYVRVTSVSRFLIGLTILLLMGAFVVWGIFGTVADRVQYKGLIFPHHGTDDVVLESNGTIIKMLVHTGDSVELGQTVARVMTRGRDSLVHSNITGTVIHTKQDRETFESLEPLVSMVSEYQPGHTLHTMVVAYVKMETHHVLRKGMEAQVWPVGDDRDKIGYARGTITSIDRYPTPPEEIINQVKSASIASILLEPNEPVWQVVIELRHSPNDPNLYDWSTGESTNVEMTIGTFCNVMTETRRRSMYEYLFN
ncbi:MAG: hypothetical protein J6035_06545 [Bacteroidaceae bacterium]|nr:hypothetical protein [Bacteroidaceae bacterium]